MGRQKNKPQMNEQEKTPEKNTNEMEIKWRDRNPIETPKNLT